MIGPFNYVQKTTNYDPQHWRQCLTAGPSQQATILTRMSEYRQQHVELICELMLLSGQRDKLVQVTVSDDEVFDHSSDHSHHCHHLYVLWFIWQLNSGELSAITPSDR